MSEPARAQDLDDDREFYEEKVPSPPVGTGTGPGHETLGCRTSEPECFFQYYKPEEFDLDGQQDPLTVNCAGVPWEDEDGDPMDPNTSHDPSVGTHDYFNDMTTDLGCDPGGVTVNRATELDYVRFGWAMIQSGMGIGVMADIVALSDVDGWDFDDGAGSHQPADMLDGAVSDYDAANGTSWHGTWAYEAALHGVHR